VAEQNRAYESLVCPMPDCTEDLYLTFEHSVDLYQGTLDDRQPLMPTDGDIGAWKVECIVGHVVLVPGVPGCICEDGDCTCDRDPSEEVRTFRASDVDRLRVLLERMGGES
jgi:hypothetical protein